MDYAFNDRDLRVKRDVSDLKLDPLFWRRVLGKNYFFASYRIHPSAAVPQVCGALSRQLQGQTDLRHRKNISVSEIDTYKSAKTIWHYIFARLTG